MSDITKCKWLGCPMKKHCYRFITQAEVNQVYYIPMPVITDGECEHFAGTPDYYKTLLDKPEELKKRIEINKQKNLPLKDLLPF